MDPARAPISSSIARQTVLVGTSGSAWPFVPRKLSGAFFFDYDPQRGVIVWSSSNSSEVLGMTDAAGASHGAFLLAHLHHADRYRVEESLSTALQSLQPCVTTYRWLRPDTNEIRILHCRAMLDSESRIVRGFIIDLSDQIPALQHECDYLASISFALSQLHQVGFVIDADFRIKSVHGIESDIDITLGYGPVQTQHIRPGALFASIFIDIRCHSDITELLAEVLCTGDKVREYGKYAARMRTIIVEGIPQGISIVFTDLSDKVEVGHARNEVSMLKGALSTQRDKAAKILDTTQEMVGFAALIARQATSNPILRHAADALIIAAKECARDASDIFDEFREHGLTPTTAPGQRATHIMPALSTTYSPNRNNEVLIAAPTLRSAHTLATLLRDSGVSTIGIRLSEPELKDAVQNHPHTRVILLDLSGDLSHDTLLIRRLRRFLPATQLLCLTHQNPEFEDKLVRAGARAILRKPATPREIERLIRKFLS